MSKMKCASVLHINGAYKDAMKTIFSSNGNINRKNKNKKQSSLRFQGGEPEFIMCMFEMKSIYFANGNINLTNKNNVLKNKKVIILFLTVI